MLTLIHGDNLEVSRAALLRLRSEAKNKEIRTLDGRTLDSAGLTQALESLSLFDKSVLVVIENLFSKLGKKTKTIEALATLLQKSSIQTDIVLWEDQEISKAALDSLGSKIKILFFKTPVVIFQFLDNLRPGNVTILLNLYRQTITDNPPELVYSLILRRLRQLIISKNGVIPPGLPSWQANRLTSQTKLFTMEKLLSMYKSLLEIEYSIKTGFSPFALNQHIEQWFVNFL